jgi:hypothetical protein
MPATACRNGTRTCNVELDSQGFYSIDLSVASGLVCVVGVEQPSMPGPAQHSQLNRMSYRLEVGAVWERELMKDDLRSLKTFPLFVPFALSRASGSGAAAGAAGVSAEREHALDRNQGALA